MKFFLQFVICGLVAWLLGPYLPYWVMMLLFILVGALIGGDGFTAFFAGGLSVGLVWFIIPFIITLKTGSDLPQKMAEVMGMGSSLTLMIITAVLGFLIGAIATLTGNRFYNLFRKDKFTY